MVTDGDDPRVVGEDCPSDGFLQDEPNCEDRKLQKTNNQITCQNLQAVNSHEAHSKPKFPSSGAERAA